MTPLTIFSKSKRRSPLMTNFSLLSGILFATFAYAETPIDYISKNAVMMNDDLKLDQSICDRLKKYKIITVGEIHGNDKSPQFVRELALSFATQSKVILALEIQQQNQAGIDDFLASGDATILEKLPHFNGSFKDG